MFDVESILSLLQTVGCGGMMLDAQGCVLNTNEKARRYLGSVFDLSRRAATRDDPVSNEAMQLALRQAMRASTRVLPQLGAYITVPRAAARPLLLRSIDFAGDEAPEGGAIAALIVLDMEDCPQPDEELLRDLFLLTPAEIRLARRLSCGDSLADLSGEFGVAVGTLRVQLKTLFLKTGTRKQGELIALLARLSRLSA